MLDIVTYVFGHQKTIAAIGLILNTQNDLPSVYFFSIYIYI